MSEDLSRNRSKIVYCVDDNETNLALLKSVLGSKGYFVVGCGSGQECLSMIWKMPPRLVLLDIQMPGMSGFDLCKRLRAAEPTRNVPVIFVTGCKTREDVRAGVAAGANDFVIKPIDPVHLLDRVQRWTGRRAET